MQKYDKVLVLRSKFEFCADSRYFLHRHGYVCLCILETLLQYLYMACDMCLQYLQYIYLQYLYLQYLGSYLCL